jgi:drug/metabolite transporter (DMT)-like permease
MKIKNLSRSRAELLLAGVIIARATSYLFSKLILKGMGVFNLLGVRFILGFVLLTALFLPRLKKLSRKTFMAGIIMGGMFFLVMTGELNGLKRTASGTASFLVNTAIVLVPLLKAVWTRRFPKAKTVLSVLLCFAGVAFLTLAGGVHFGAGERWCLIAALLYACTILITDRLSHSGIDTLAAGIVQVGTIGVLSLAASFLFETPRLPNRTMEWIGIVMLAVVCTGFGFTLQPVAQSGTSAERAGMFCALNPMVASTLGVLFLGESFTVQSIIGGMFILAGILLAELPERNVGKKHLLQRKDVARCAE